MLEVGTRVRIRDDNAIEVDLDLPDDCKVSGLIGTIKNGFSHRNDLFAIELDSPPPKLAEYSEFLFYTNELDIVNDP